MPKLVASKSLIYGGKSLSKGDEFDAVKQDAKILTAIGKAQYVITVADVEKVPAKEEKKTRGEYKRRDMTAEPRQARVKKEKPPAAETDLLETTSPKAE